MIKLDNIPIENIYYMLCYSFNKLDYLNRMDVNLLEQKDMSNLLCYILVKEVSVLVKRGFLKDYTSYTDETSDVKGCINISQSVSNIYSKKGKLYCSYDEYSDNIVANQIIKSTLVNLSKAKTLSKENRNLVQKLLLHFQGTKLIKLNKNVFNQIINSRKSKQYEFAIKVCRIAYLGCLMESNGAQYGFIDFIRDSEKMCYFYEEFIRNFYIAEVKNAEVKRERILWNFNGDSNAIALLPRMETDVSIIFNDRKIIIDAKYYKDIFEYNWGVKKVNIKHIYQMFAYLKNNKSKYPNTFPIDGILLYPETKEEVSCCYNFDNHNLKVKSLNLNCKWNEVYKQLIELIELDT